MTNESMNQPGKSYTMGDISNITDSQFLQGENITGGNITKTNSSNTFTDLKVEIRRTLDELAKTPLTSDEDVATAAIKKQIKDNPTLKQRLISALKGGGEEALKEIFDHPVVSISIATIKGFLEGN